MRPLVFIALFAAWGTLAVSTPQQVDRRPTISVETDLVMLPVTVVDQHGVFVPGLTREQFTVYDNGERQAIEFFTSEETPATVGLVIDSSGSMRRHRDQVTAAGTAFAGLSHPLDELFTVNFNDTVWLGLPASAAFAADIDQLHAALARAPAQGMTALYDAVLGALDHLRLGSQDRKVLIVVSDGGDNASVQTFDTVLAQAQLAGAVIYAVILADSDDHDAKPYVLKKFAHATGGEAFTPTRAEDVMTAFTQIAREIRSGYTIGFSPVDAPDDGFRSVRVVADAGNRRQLLVRTRAGYYAGRSGGALR